MKISLRSVPGAVGRCIIALLLFFLFAEVTVAAELPTAWRELKSLPQSPAQGQAQIRPAKFHAFQLNPTAMRQILQRAPMEARGRTVFEGDEILLPMPYGTLARFRFIESPVMAPELAAEFPQIKTYLGQGLDDPTASVRFDLTPSGLHAQILSPRGAVYIDPAFAGDSETHLSYYKRDYRRAADGFTCVVANENEEVPIPAARNVALRSGGSLRTYRLACAATGEYTQYHGGSVSSGMAAIVTAINRVTGIYELELGIRLVLVANNQLLVYTNGSTDPYTNNDGSKMLGENQSNVDSVIGNSNYDIGHVFSTGGGGIAYLRSVCVSANKAKGVTGLPAPIGDAFYVDYVAHEMGHQFGGNHTFNSEASSCGGGNRNASTAYEPGSGSTIQAYAGICGADNLQSNSDPYFHSISFDEMYAYVSTGGGSSCAVVTSTGNTAPTVSAGPSFTIPRSTPFALTATGSDANGDILTYCWEERDLGPAAPLADPDNGSSPLFRSFNPTTSPSRTFPKLSSILNNTSSLGEKLPTTSRTMVFRVTARDNRVGGGGINTSDTQVSVNSSAGPFFVTAPGSNVTWSNLQFVTWNVAGTASAPVNATNVNILLSTNGGLTFPHVLKLNTPNDGSERVLLPNISSSSARIKVEAVANIFFDISDGNFTLLAYPPAPEVVIDSATIASEGCSPGNGAIDPNETVTINVMLRNIGSADASNVSATLLAINGIIEPTPAQDYGVLVAGAGSVSRPFTFTAAGSCGGILSAVFEIRLGVALLGNVTNVFTLGGVAPQTVSAANVGRIKVPATGNSGNASPYPSGISFSGVQGAVTKVTVTLSNVVHSFPDDIDVLLVAPNGQSVLLMSDAGGEFGINNLTLTFDDSGASALPDGGQILSGTYSPSNYDTTSDGFVSPAPAGPYGSSLAAFNGINPNGAWSLYCRDDAVPDGGDIMSGWRLTITTAVPNCCTQSNLPPIISAIGNQTINEDSNVLVNFSVNDAETPAGSLVVSASSSNTNLLSNNNLGLSGTGTNRSLLITPAANQSGSSTVTVSVSDGSLVAAKSFLLTVNAVNDAPVLAPIGDKAVNEGALLTITNAAVDIDTPQGQLTFTLGTNAPGGMAINTSSGVLTWTPSEEQGPGVYQISVVVEDHSSPSLSDSKSFTVTVNEVNSGPTLNSIANRTIHAGSTLTFTNVASDPDIPANSLTYSMDPVSPIGSSIDPASGVFSWVTSAADAGTTNLVTMRVTDNGVPVLSGTQTFSITVVPAPVQFIAFDVGDVALTWTAVPGQNYWVESKTNLNISGWTLLTNITAIADTISITNSVAGQETYYRIVVP